MRCAECNTEVQDGENGVVDGNVALCDEHLYVGVMPEAVIIVQSVEVGHCTECERPITTDDLRCQNQACRRYYHPGCSDTEYWGLCPRCAETRKASQKLPTTPVQAMRAEPPVMPRSPRPTYVNNAFRH